MGEYEISRTTGRCSVSGRVFTEGETFHTVLFETPHGYERRDFSEECWQGPPPDSLCHFLAQLPKKEKPHKTFVDDEVLLDFFRRMGDSQDTHKLRFRFVLSLILMRKRLLKYERTIRQEGSEVWEMRLVRDKSSHRVLHPTMNDAEIEELTRELGTILQGGQATGDVAEDVGAAEGMEDGEKPPAGPSPLRTVGLVLGMVCLLSGLGCPSRPIKPEGPPSPPRELREIVDVVEQNDALLDQPLWSQGVTVSAKFTDDKGKQHSYNLEGSFLFRRPRSLRMDLRPSMGDQVMQIGSNDEDYWIWIEPEIKTMRWGRHRYTGKPCAESIAVRPDQMAAALGLCGLPKADSGLIGPIRKYGESQDILYYVRLQPTGEYRLEQEYFVDRHPPFMIRVVRYLDAFGRDVMNGCLDDYRPAWKDGPLIAHKISVFWPKDGGQLTLSLGTTKNMEPGKVSPKAFLRPERSNLPPGIERIIQVDAPCDTLAVP
jgi:hypothetical protein